ncbi:MAG TPA: hypothetical protein VGR22_06430, partial [Thermomicrobiales bacterium]|nr:hypothetical protein [Thermomicrobiales bacterium]
MSAFPFTDQSRIRRRHGLSFPLLLSLAVASALTGAVVALVVQRLLQGAQYTEVLPRPASVRHLQESSAPSESSETAGEASVAPDLAERAELATA